MKNLSGWNVINGAGWNHHKTADAMLEILAQNPDSLPAIPAGYAVAVANIDNRPFGLRCSLVKMLARKTDDEGLDDGCDGEADSWIWNNFGVEAERIYSCKEDETNEDSSAYFIRKISEQLKLLPVS